MFNHQWLRPSPDQPNRAIKRTGQHPRKKIRASLRLESLEERCLLDGTGYRPITEIGNNLANPSWGIAYADLLRIAAAAYADGISAPSLPQDQSARIISNILNNQAGPNNPSLDINTVDQQKLSDFGYVWGQFKIGRAHV